MMAVDKRIVMTICLITSCMSGQAQKIMNRKMFLEDLFQIIPKPKFSSINEFLNESDNFNRNIRKAPTNANWINESMDKNVLNAFLNFANSAYPILHEDVLYLCHEFLQIKKVHGSVIEKNLYKSMTVIDVIDRLIKKRPLVFVGSEDEYLLRNGASGKDNWTLIGQDNLNLTSSNDKVPSIEDYMTYDEIKLAAFLQVSSFVKPINSGNRKNRGKTTSNGEPCSDMNIICLEHDTEAVYVGAVGARFEKPYLMEWQEMISSKSIESESKDSPIKNLFLNFYSERLDFGASENMKDYLDLEEVKLNHPIYMERIMIIAETYLLEANQRGKFEELNVHVVVVGLGLGVWKISHHQPELFLNAFENTIKKLWEQKLIPYIKEVEFQWIDQVSKFHDEFLPGTDIKITYSKQDPFSRNNGDNNLKVAMFAWDGNSFPGNEYWYGSLDTSGDPAAASCTQIPQLQNSYINIPNICALNTHIASPEFGLLHISEYAKKKIKNEIRMNESEVAERTEL